MTIYHFSQINPTKALIVPMATEDVNITARAHLTDITARVIEDSV